MCCVTLHRNRLRLTKTTGLVGFKKVVGGYFPHVDSLFKSENGVTPWIHLVNSRGAYGGVATKSKLHAAYLNTSVIKTDTKAVSPLGIT